MSSDYVISSDSTCDLPESYVKEHGLNILLLAYRFGDISYTKETLLDPAVFYDRMRNGEMPQTTAAIPEEIRNSFEPFLKEGKDIIHFSFSSALTSSYNNECIVARDLMEEYPERQVVVIDSLSASLGQGLLVHYAVQMKEKGASLEEVSEWIEANKLSFCHQFTVNDLFHLHRGGRISKAAAILGTIASIKPVLNVDNEGRLIPQCNVRSRKKSLLKMVDNMEEKIVGFQNDVVFIGHGGNLEDAKFVADEVTKRFGITNILIDYISPTIGAHAGPDTIALFFRGNER